MTEQNRELESVKRRIRALASKTPDAGATVEECNAAFAKIGQLLETFNLSMDEVILSQQEMVQKSYDTQQKQRSSSYSASVAIGKLTGTKIWVTRGATIKIHFFGLESDVEMAVYLCEFIDKSFVGIYDEFKKSADYVNFTGHRKQIGSSFKNGFETGCYDKINRIADESRTRQEEAAKYHQDQMADKMIGLSEEARVKVAEATTGTALIVTAKEKLVEEEFKKMGMRLRTGYSSRVVSSREGFNIGVDKSSSLNFNRPINNGGNSKISGYLS